MPKSRKTANFSWEALDALLQFKTTIKFCADYMGCSPDTIQRRIKEEHEGMSFSEYHQTQMQNTGLKLQQKAIDMAMKGDKTMMIFCLKNLAGWTEKAETKTEMVGRIEIDEADKAV